MQQSHSEKDDQTHENGYEDNVSAYDGEGKGIRDEQRRADSEIGEPSALENVG
jgi:hypothetical protein